MSRRTFIALAFSSLLLALMAPSSVAAEGVCLKAGIFAQLVSVQGSVRRNGVPATLQERIDPGDAIEVGADSRAAIYICAKDIVLRLDANTELRLKPPQGERSLLGLVRGAVHFFSHQRQLLEFETTFVNAGADGTEFVVRVDATGTRITVVSGKVSASNAQGKVKLAAGAQSTTAPGAAPGRPLPVRPSDAVQWAVYYPAVFAGAQGEETDPRLASAADALLRSDLRKAFRILDAVAVGDRGADFFAYRAGFRLSVGQAELAAADILQALARDAGNDIARALQAIIAITQSRGKNEKLAAKELASASADSIPGLIALSYAQQSLFDLQGALQSMRLAVEKSPQNALAHARLAELKLSLGELSAALHAAQTAKALRPDLASTQTVLGFAYLTRIDIARSRQAFESAIELDQADPLPRLGLGLSHIRGGELDRGRRNIEIAVSLDPNRSQLRSYVAKAYFEERHAGPTLDELDLAKDLDELDPTPYYYSAIVRHLLNDPVAALSELEESIARNDNRAVFRSKQQLDADRAMRGASQARIYADLGFNKLAELEGSRALELEPSNYSAHRLLSDSYAGRRRQETARVSELFQSQMNQPININPVQPQLASTGLDILVGAAPSQSTLNEYTPLFEGNGHRLYTSALAGSEDTWGDELVVAGIYNRVSYSIGQFHYETDGFRENNDLEHDIGNAFAQVAVTDRLGVQVEYQRRRTNQGDRRLNFDPDDFSRNLRRGITRESARLGLKFSPSQQSDLLLAGSIVSIIDKSTDDTPPITADSRADQEGHDLQGQYQLRDNAFNLVAGGDSYKLDNDSVDVLDISGLFGGVCPPPPIIPTCDIVLVTDSNIEHQSAYAYGYASWPQSLKTTLGFSYDAYQQGALNRHQFGPKAGVQWDITDSVTLRLGYSQSVRRALATERTLEPTQVAGFNQFYDDVSGTEAELFGAGLDLRLTKSTYGGVEFVRRNLDVPASDATTGSFFLESQREYLNRAYVYFAPARAWALSAEYQFEKFRRKDAVVLPLPRRVETTIVPVTLGYFSAIDPIRPMLTRGLFARLRATHVRQKVLLSTVSTFPRDRDNFWVVDASVGYRLPRRRGIVSLEAQNLLDEEFLFQDSNIQNLEPTTPRFIPDRTLFLRVSLNF